MQETRGLNVLVSPRTGDSIKERMATLLRQSSASAPAGPSDTLYTPRGSVSKYISITVHIDDEVQVNLSNLSVNISIDQLKGKLLKECKTRPELSGVLRNNYMLYSWEDKPLTIDFQRLNKLVPEIKAGVIIQLKYKSIGRVQSKKPVASKFKFKVGTSSGLVNSRDEKARLAKLEAESRAQAVESARRHREAEAEAERAEAEAERQREAETEEGEAIALEDTVTTTSADFEVGETFKSPRLIGTPPTITLINDPIPEVDAKPQLNERQPQLNERQRAKTEARQVLEGEEAVAEARALVRANAKQEAQQEANQLDIEEARAKVRADAEAAAAEQRRDREIDQEIQKKKEHEAQLKAQVEEKKQLLLKMMAQVEEQERLILEKKRAAAIAAESPSRESPRLERSKGIKKLNETSDSTQAERTRSESTGEPDAPTLLNVPGKKALMRSPRHQRWTMEGELLVSSSDDPSTPVAADATHSTGVEPSSTSFGTYTTAKPDHPQKSALAGASLNISASTGFLAASETEDSVATPEKTPLRRGKKNGTSKSAARKEDKPKAFFTPTNILSRISKGHRRRASTSSSPVAFEGITGGRIPQFKFLGQANVVGHNNKIVYADSIGTRGGVWIPPITSLISSAASFDIEPSLDFTDGKTQPWDSSNLSLLLPQARVFPIDWEHATHYVGVDDKLGPLVLSIQSPEHHQSDELTQVDNDSDPPVVVLSCFRGAFRLLINREVTEGYDELMKRIRKKGAKGRNIIASLRDQLSSVFHVNGGTSFKEVKGKPRFHRELKPFVASCAPTDIKVGVLYCKKGQTEENEMFHNCAEEVSPEFQHVVEGVLGHVIKLKGWKGYRGGLDVNRDTTGTHSVYTEQSIDTGVSEEPTQVHHVMYHVSTMLPFYAADHQQLERKRHLGNDVVCIVVVDDPDANYNPESFVTEFIHTFIVVHCVKIDEEYRVSVTNRIGVMIGAPPYLPANGLFHSAEQLSRWIVAKCINAQIAAFQCVTFSSKLERTRKMQLQMLIDEIK